MSIIRRLSTACDSRLLRTEVCCKFMMLKPLSQSADDTGYTLIKRWSSANCGLSFLVFRAAESGAKRRNKRDGGRVGWGGKGRKEIGGQGLDNPQNLKAGDARGVYPPIFSKFWRKKSPRIKVLFNRSIMWHFFITPADTLHGPYKNSNKQKHI